MGWQGIDDWLADRGETERTRPVEAYERRTGTDRQEFGVQRRLHARPIEDRSGPRTCARVNIDSEAACAMVANGMSVREVAEFFGVREPSIYYHLKRRGIQIDRRRSA